MPPASTVAVGIDRASFFQRLSRPVCRKLTSLTTVSTSWWAWLFAVSGREPNTHGHCFISLEDETRIVNLFVKKENFHLFRMVITAEPFLLAKGRLERSEGDQPTVFVTEVSPLPRIDCLQAAASHDFH